MSIRHSNHSTQIPKKRHVKHEVVVFALCRYQKMSSFIAKSPYWETCSAVNMAVLLRWEAILLTGCTVLMLPS